MPAPRTIVFCEPPYLFWDRGRDRLRQGEETIPGMGVLMLAAVARQHGYRVHLLDAKRQGTPLDDVCRTIEALRPDVLGLSATTISVANAARIAARIKQVLPKVVTVLGGAHVSAIPERTLAAYPAIDYGIVGEGEVSLFALLERLERGAPIGDVPGVAYRDNGRPIATPRAPYIDDLDALPDPAWDLLPEFPHRFQPSLFSYPRTPVATLITSRGCPFTCVFCDRSTSGRKGRLHSVATVVRLVRELAERGARHVIFLDDLFTVRRQRVVEICEAFLDAGLDVTWSCNSHPNLLDPETMALMRRAGCWQIAYGIESGSQRVLNHVKHEVKIDRLLKTLHMTREAGLKIKGLMMCAHPTETVESLAETNRFLRTAPLDLMQLTKFTPYPGTPSYPTIHEYGTFVEDWENMNAMNFVFIPNGLDVPTLEYWFHRMYRTFYTRPDVLLGLAKVVLEEPRFLGRLRGYAGPYMAGALRRMWQSWRPPAETATPRAAA